MIYRKVKTNLSRTLSSIEQDKATSDDYVKCILADPQIAAYIVQALVPEFKEMEAEKIIPCIGEPTVMLRFPERLGVKIQNVNNESVDEDNRLCYAHYIPELDQGVENKRLLRRKTAAKYLYLANFDDIYKGGIQYVCNRKKE